MFDTLDAIKADATPVNAWSYGTVTTDNPKGYASLFKRLESPLILR